MDLSNKTIVLTGAGGFFGRCMSSVLSSQNARMVLSDIDEKLAAPVLEQLKAQGHEAMFYKADVAKENELHDLMNAAAETFGGIDVLVNNAGLLGQEHGVGLLELDVELWDRTFTLNARSVFLASKHAIPHMIKGGGGSIINISSGSSISGYYWVNAYASSKAAVNTLTRYIAAGFGKENIRCNAILPGTNLSPEAVARTDKEAVRLLTEHCMLPRLGEAEDVANLVAFLASDSAYYITAQLIQVDGGLLNHIPQMAESRRRGDGFYRSKLKLES